MNVVDIDICRDNFTDPVVTQCGHYFCQQCAMKRNKTVSTKCIVCNKPTFGVFNRARKLIKHIAKLKGNNGTSATEDRNAKEDSTAIQFTTTRHKKGSWVVVDD